MGSRDVAPGLGVSDAADGAYTMADRAKEVACHDGC